MHFPLRDTIKAVKLWEKIREIKNDEEFPFHLACVGFDIIFVAVLFFIFSYLLLIFAVWLGIWMLVIGGMLFLFGGFIVGIAVVIESEPS